MALLELFDITKLVAEGNFSALPSRFIFDFEKVRPEDFVALIDLLRSRGFGHNVLENLQIPEIMPLQKMKNLVHTGAFSKVLTDIEQIDPMKENSELAIEKARALVFTGRFQEALDCLTPHLSTGFVSTGSRGVAIQLMGHCQLELGDLNKATDNFEKALKIADTVGNTAGKLSAYLFLAKCKALEEDFIEANKNLSLALYCIKDEVQNFRWTLGYFRTASQVAFLSRDTRSISLALAGALIAKQINDDHHYIKCLAEASLFIKIFHCKTPKLDQEFSNLISEYPSDSNSDLIQWIQAARGQIPQDPMGYSLFHFLKNLKFHNLDRVESDCALTDAHFKNLFASQWIYDMKSELFVCLKSGIHRSISKGSPIVKLLNLAKSNDNSEFNGQTLKEVFEGIWGLKWSQERHMGTLKITLHRLNNLSPHIKMTRKNGKIRQNVLGFIF